MNWPGVSSAHDRLTRGGGGRDASAGVESSSVGIILDRRDAMRGEEIGQQPHHHFAVLQHVGDARGRARIVLENVELVLAGAHDVDAGDVHLDVVRRAAARHLRAEVRIAEDEIGTERSRRAGSRGRRRCPRGRR